MDADELAGSPRSGVVANHDRDIGETGPGGGKNTVRRLRQLVAPWKMNSGSRKPNGNRNKNSGYPIGPPTIGDMKTIIEKERLVHALGDQ